MKCGRPFRLILTPIPSEHLAADPHGFFKTWMAPHYPYPENYTGMGAVTVGQHWTRSPEIIPERFVEPVPAEASAGRADGRPESPGRSRRMAHYESEPPEGVSWHEHVAATAKSERGCPTRTRSRASTSLLISPAVTPIVRARRSRSDGRHLARRGARATTSVGTNYEDELNLPIGSHVQVTGARLYIPTFG